MQETDRLSKSDLSKYAEDIQALLINLTVSPSLSPDQKLRLLSDLDLSKRLMRNGIVWLWSEIPILPELIRLMEKKNFKYIEHFTLVHLSIQRALAFPDPNERKAYNTMLRDEGKPKAGSEESSEELDETQSSEVSAGGKHGSSYEWLMGRLMTKKTMRTNEIFADVEETDGFLRKSKSVLLMFRRVFFDIPGNVRVFGKFDVKNSQLELRHQRTCDVLFDLVDETDRSLGIIPNKFTRYLRNLLTLFRPA